LIAQIGALRLKNEILDHPLRCSFILKSNVATLNEVIAVIRLPSFALRKADLD